MLVVLLCSLLSVQNYTAEAGLLKMYFCDRWNLEQNSVGRTIECVATVTRLIMAALLWCFVECNCFDPCDTHEVPRLLIGKKDN